MKLEINDEAFEALLVAWLRQRKAWAEEDLAKNNYMMEEDRLWDEEYLRGLNIMLKNHEVPE